MASNPIQRRARQSFLVGFLIALIIMAIVVVILFMRISNLNEENASLQTLQSTNTKTIYTLVDDVKSGETITLDMLVSTSVLAQINVDNYLSSADFFDDEGNEREWVAKTDLTGGSPILRDTASVSDDVLTDDERLMEFNIKGRDVVLNDELLKKIDKLLLEKTEYKKDDRVIIIGSIPNLITGRTNFVRVHRMCAF